MRFKDYKHENLFFKWKKKTSNTQLAFDEEETGARRRFQFSYAKEKYQTKMMFASRNWNRKSKI